MKGRREEKRGREGRGPSTGDSGSTGLCEDSTLPPFTTPPHPLHTSSKSRVMNLQDPILLTFLTVNGLLSLPRVWALGLVFSN